MKIWKDKGENRNFLVEKLNNISLGKKLMILQIVCVLLPLLITDSAICLLIVNADKKAALQEMNNIADSVGYTLGDYIDNAADLMQNIYINRYVNEFMKLDFDSAYDYYDKYLEFIKDSLYTVSVSSGHFHTVIYGDNDGIINGGYFKRLEMAENEQWYQELEKGKGEVIIYADYVKNGYTSQRVISLVRYMDYYHKKQEKSAIKLDLDYSSMLITLINAKYAETVYVCDGDRILFSNDGKGGMQAPFELMPAEKMQKAGVHKTVNVYGDIWDIYVMTPKIDAQAILMANLPLIVCLICINLVLPFMLMRLINQSFTQRVKELGTVFENVDGDELKPLKEVAGHDEISSLMESYNRMAIRMNELIQTVYKDRLRSQEIDIARQKAELLALHSQINPHFLFNALESIRMHSVLKKEFETADMVQKLALMERQNVDWGNDFVHVREEIKFIEAYLELQKYRFGERLAYEISMDEECGDYRLPKLTLVTFVENACVHGMENKTSKSWVFVRIYKEGEELTMEVEDTGSGMPEDQCKKLEQEMADIRIEMIKEKSHVGILNAALRLKMATGGRVRFEISSEIGEGTMVVINMPFKEIESIHEM